MLDFLSFDWMLFVLSDGNFLLQKELEKLDTLDFLKQLYFKQVKTLKEAEAIYRSQNDKW